MRSLPSFGYRLGEPKRRPRLVNGHLARIGEFEPATGAGDGETSVFFSANAHLFPAQARLIQTVRGRGLPFVLVALRNPYDRDLVTRKETVVLSYGFLPNALGAVLKRVLRWEGP